MWSRQFSAIFWYRYKPNEVAALLTGWLDKIFSRRSAARAGRDNPLLAAAVQKSSEIYQKTPLARMLDTEVRDELSRSLFLEINEICNSLEPVSTCREKLAAAMMTYASYQVLVIPPLPQHDLSGLRLMPGVTGELKQELLRVVQNSPELRSELHGLLQDADFDVLWQPLLTLYWKSYWRLETFNAARVELRDVTEERDWYPAFKHAACASVEDKYRRESGLPSAFDPPIAATAPTAYAIYTDIVLSGASDPDSEWRDYHAGSNIPAPRVNPVLAADQPD